MSLRLLVRDRPQRSIALETDTHILIFRHSPSASSAAVGSKTASNSTPRCMVEFSPLDSIDIADYHTVQSIGVYGTLGLISIAEDIFICVISGSVRVATVRPNETIQRITAVEFCEYNKPTSIAGLC